jgi:hypothetical protein
MSGLPRSGLKAEQKSGPPTDSLYGLGGQPLENLPGLPGDGGYFLHAQFLKFHHPSTANKSISRQLCRLGSPRSPTARDRGNPELDHARYFAHDGRRNFDFLFRLHQLRNNRGNLVEDLVPALKLTAVFCALHGFVSSEGELRLAVSEILKDGHVVRAVDSLMFYS